ncbi:unnamed protein product [Adineta ricciae]|uniref:Tyrosine-protein kinase ephrin type A/B receptor-like domain-containing protein n=1 Tax=Adineta ricciae TaxID=249248 RepID=A0A813Y874_ADIRI|nr:unnamed protein product [Adineta ricciae]
MAHHSRLAIFFLILLFIDNSYTAFPPSLLDYNAYGVKIAMNEYFFVEVQNDNYAPGFLVQFAPYNDTPVSVQCTVTFRNSIDHYIYSVTMGKSQQQFFFAGELTNTKNGTFIGVAKYNASSSSCDTRFSFTVQYFYNYEHQEYYVIHVEPSGRYAYGFANKFIFIFDSFNISLNVWNGNETWPDHSFSPHAIDITNNFSVIAGFIRNAVDATAVYIPVIYLINFSSFTNYPYIVDQYRPNATVDTWQYLLTNSDADTYSAKYDMSVSINNNGGVLVGMQFINRVFLFSVARSNPIRLYFISRNTNGRSLGNGKSVAWLDNGFAAILVNTYSLNYQWASSEIYVYDIQTYGYNSNSTPLSIFPNQHQLLPLSFSSIFLQIISSPSSLALLDDQGNVLIMNPTPSGYFPAVRDSGSMPVFTSAQLCFPGTYKNRSGIHDCSICPSGTKNGGNSSTQCVACATNSFCPLGSVSDIPLSALTTTKQVIAYPKSPESIIFDEILLQNMFHIGSGHCLVVSPIFWSLIVAAFAVLIVILMSILKHRVDHPQSRKIRQRLKCIFKHTDLIGEGELWVGGLVSFAVVVLVSFAYSFSRQYLYQYPIESASDSHFACDPSLRNAKFQTNLQSISIPPTDAEQKMFYLLNNQTFTLHLDFVNTAANCDIISLQVLYGTRWSTIRWLSCSNVNSILSLTVVLPYQHASIQIYISGTQIIGALRVGLSSAGQEDEHYNLKELNFYQAFYKYGEVLTQNLSINLDMTKVINETAAMVGEESDYSGIYIPTFTTDIDSLFLTEDQYVYSTSSSALLTLVISETPYYVKNLQEPIAKLSEIIFHNILFTVVCLEIFGLIFLLYKLVSTPLRHVYRSCYAAKHKKNNERICVF